MNITVCHSHQDRCGIREYGNQLDRSFVDLGARVRKCSYAYLGEVVSQIEPGSVFLVHFEPGLVTPWYLTQYLTVARARGARTALCCHWYEYEYMKQYEGFVDRFVIHREYPRMHEQSTIIPLGCPIYTPKDNRGELRVRFGLPADATVLTTIGFLTRWKTIPNVVLAMLDTVAGLPNLHVRIHTPWPFDESDADPRGEEARTREIMAMHACKRASFSTDFLSEEDALDLVRASDLGFIFHSFHTNSVSAATKQFVSARRPVVVTGSNHASDLRGGVVRVETFDPSIFAKVVAAVASNREMTSKLQQEIEAEYARLNMAVVAKQYLDLFEKLHRERAVDR